MAKGFKHGAGGGTSLNFKVVGNPQPETAKDNTIWVDTDVKITGWDFNAAQPETAKEGMVWISTGTSSSSEFNALKKNGIVVYPMSAKQYVSGAWVNKTAKIYQNGEWKTMLPLGYLFYFGKQQYLWQARGWAMSQYGFTAKSPTVTENTDGSVTISMPHSSTKYSGVYEIAEDFDVTNYNTLTIDETHNHLGYYLAVVNRNATYCHENSVAVATLDNSNTLDISSLNGKYDIVIIIRVGQSGEGTTAKEMIFNSLIAE